MNFAELRAWELLGGGLAVILLLRAIFFSGPRTDSARYDKVSLALLGALLLAAVDWLTLLIFLTVAAITYAGVAWFRHHPPRRCGWFLGCLIPLQLLPLLYFKYSHFLANEVAGADWDWLRGLVIPAGISFYSFQLVAFAVDTLIHRHPVPHWLDFLNFAGFFPQIVAGPIERRTHLLPQIERFRFRWDPGAIDDGAGWIVLGLFLKTCIADNLALYFNAEVVSNAYFLWLDNLLFGLRIYYDFAGYSLIALGLARCFSIRLTLNFASPYAAVNIGEFWRRWHITLSQWFRDYAYIPLGGNRVARWKRNILIVFVVSGIWHGAGWNFMLWGFLHALYLIGLRWYGKRFSPRPVSWALTMLGVFFAWLFFYETRPSMLWHKAGALLSWQGYTLSRWGEMTGYLHTPDAFVMACFVSLAGIVLGLEWISLRRRGEAYYYLRHPAVLGILIVLMVWLAPGRNNSFIYFAF